MPWATLATIAVAVIAAASALASARAAAAATRATADASRENTQDTNRTDMEREAYLRAREFDTETIKRQDSEIHELQAENQALRSDVRELTVRVTDLERELGVAKAALALVHQDD